MKDTKRKPSELFEGENSALRKTFDDIVSNEEGIREEFVKKWGNQIDMYDDGSPIYPASLNDVVDWWLSKLSEERQRVEASYQEAILFCHTIPAKFTRDVAYERGVKETIEKVRKMPLDDYQVGEIDQIEKDLLGEELINPSNSQNSSAKV